jgi:hypothetical protein
LQHYYYAKNKLSIENVSDIICLSVNNEQLPLTQLAPKFKSTSVNSEDENILNGIFTLSNGIIFSAPNSLNCKTYICNGKPLSLTGPVLHLRSLPVGMTARVGWLHTIRISSLLLIN